MWVFISAYCAMKWHTAPRKLQHIRSTTSVYRINKNLGRIQYSGEFLSSTKVMEGCARGGQVLISASTKDQLEAARIPPDLLVLHMGRVAVAKEAQNAKFCQPVHGQTSGKNAPSVQQDGAFSSMPSIRAVKQTEDLLAGRPANKFMLSFGAIQTSEFDPAVQPGLSEHEVYTAVLDRLSPRLYLLDAVKVDAMLVRERALQKQVLERALQKQGLIPAVQS
jgi:hypothetical protein